MALPSEDDLLSLIFDVARMMRLRGDQRARTIGMTRAQWVILIWVCRKPGISQNELAALVEVEPITVARLLDRLEARKLVERRHDLKDRRMWRLHLTEAAQPILHEIETYRAELNPLATAGISDADKAVMIAALKQVKANLQADKPCRPDPNS